MTGAELQKKLDAPGSESVHLEPGVIPVYAPLRVTGSKKLVGAGRGHQGVLYSNGTRLDSYVQNGPTINFDQVRNAGAESFSVRYMNGPTEPYSQFTPTTAFGIDYFPPVGEEGGSSGVLISDVDISNFPVGVITQPQRDAQGEYVTMENSAAYNVGVMFSVCQTQARKLVVLNCREFNSVGTFLTNNTHGAKSGNPQAWVAGCAFNVVDKLCDLTGGGVNVFDACYGEQIGGLGRFWDGSARRAVPTKFRDCEFRIVGRGLLAEEGSIILDGGFIETPDIAVMSSRCEVRGTKFCPVKYEQSPSFAVARRRAANLTCGLVCRLGDPEQPPRTGCTAAWFVDPDNSDVQVGRDGAFVPPKRQTELRDKEYCQFFPGEPDSIYLAHVQPGSIVQDSVTLTTWIVTEEITTGRYALDRLNNPDAVIGPDGYFWVQQP